MKIAVLSDIHSNMIALKACIAYMKSIACDEYMFLGDYISDTPYTRETMEYLYAFAAKHKCMFLKGNREEYMLAQRDAIAQNAREKIWGWNSGEGNLRFTYEQLSEKDLCFFESLPITVEYEREGYPAITFCHGSPECARELLFAGAENTKAWLEAVSTDYLICAHTHRPCDWTYKGKHYYNGGSVGIAISDYGFAQCIVLEDVRMGGRAEWKPAFLKIPYDNRRVVSDIYKSGLLDSAPWFVNSNIRILLTGVDQCAELAALARKLSEQAGEEGTVSEMYWEKAAQRLGVPDYRKAPNIDAEGK